MDELMIFGMQSGVLVQWLRYQTHEGIAFAESSLLCGRGKCLFNNTVKPKLYYFKRSFMSAKSMILLFKGIEY